MCVRKRVASCEGERERERGVNYLHQSRTKSSFDQKNVELQKFPKIEATNLDYINYLLLCPILPFHAVTQVTTKLINAEINFG